MPEAGHGGHGFFLVNRGQNHLAELAEKTAGEAYMLGLSGPVGFGPYLDQISARLKHQYAATVMMKPESKPGLRAIRFTTEVPNAAIVAAARVYVRAESDAGVTDGSPIAAQTPSMRASRRLKAPRFRAPAQREPALAE